MNHSQTLMGAALAAVFATTALAAGPASAPGATGNKADATKVMPARSDLQPGAAPTVRTLDDNVQRQHDRNSGVAKPTAPANTAATPPAAAGQGRDWAAIDKNKDNLISPEEMEDFLKQGRTTPAPKS